MTKYIVLCINHIHFHIIDEYGSQFIVSKTRTKALSFTTVLVCILLASLYFTSTRTSPFNCNFTNPFAMPLNYTSVTYHYVLK